MRYMMNQNSVVIPEPIRNICKQCKCAKINHNKELCKSCKITNFELNEKQNIIEVN